MATLAEIRKKLLEQENIKGGNFVTDNAIFPFWNMKEGSTSIFRYLPDANTDNVYFWRERQMIRIPFSGIKGRSESKPLTVTVPCAEMWSDIRCPIHDEIRPWFKDSSMEDLARKYWKKKSYLFQGFVTETDMQEDNTPDNPIRRFIINPSIFNIIKAALMDPDFAEIPTDYEAGTDFKLVKTQKGQYADYSTSNWARRERSLNETERAAIDKYGLFNLDDFMPKKPSEKELEIIQQMFEASIDGDLYDPDRFAEFFKPAGLNSNNNDSDNKTESNKPSAAVKPKADKTESADSKETPVVNDTGWKEPKGKEESTKDNSEEKSDAPSAADILAKIRQRKNTKADG